MVKPSNTLDEFSLTLLKNVFPSDWKNPVPQELYDLVVIGGGPGGMTAATIAKNLGAKVALVEKEHLGGECLSVGCIPSKALIKSSRIANAVRDAKEFGIDIPDGWKVDFDFVMKRVHRLQSRLAPHDSAQHFQHLGIDVFFGEAKFSSSKTIEVKGQQLNFKKAIIATGTLPVKLKIPGLEEVGYQTNQTIFNLKTLPESLAVIGAGPIGCELAQAFLRLGSKVTLITHGPKILPREEAIASDRLRKVFEEEKMQILTDCKVKKVEKQNGLKVLFCEGHKEIKVEEILVASGRVPAVEGLDLDIAGVDFDLKEGIKNNDLLETSNPNIYAIGDVGSSYKFTHITMEMAKMAVYNALKNGSFKKGDLVIPWCTFTEPEIAHVGLYEKDAQKLGIKTRSVVFELKDIDRAILDGETEGFVKILVKEENDTILGATIVANHAGGMLPELTLAIVGGLGLKMIVKTIHIFPTQSQAIRKAAEMLP
jgi:pyruvate/2-oxoglutarate dehydrogenase complex dihydrolipoamide dehydrogenase (E3) component